jgi:hypothetical protein
MKATVEIRYDVDHGGYHWKVSAPNPGKAEHGWLPSFVTESGFAKRERSAQRAASRALRSLAGRLAQWRPTTVEKVDLGPSEVARKVSA